MDFKIRSDTSESGDNRRQPLNYTSRRVRLRLATLVTLLGVSLLAMNEAGKPETWERLGFAADPTSQDTKVASPSTRLKVTEDLDEQNVGFWKEQFQKLSLTERKLLFQIVEERLLKKRFRGSVESIRQLLDKLENEVDQLQESDQVTAVEIDSILPIIEGLYAWLDSGTDLAEETNELSIETLQQLQDELDRCAYSMVEDHSSLGRSAESIAWIRSWKKLQPLEGNLNPTETNIVELVGQPNAYRGRPVHISGTARGLEKVEVASNDLEFESYFVLWNKPLEMSRTPYCVYVRSLPVAFPDAGSTFQNINEPVSIDGIFSSFDPMWQLTIKLKRVR